jgi:hypothetical protein
MAQRKLSSISLPFHPMYAFGRYLSWAEMMRMAFGELFAEFKARPEVKLDQLGSPEVNKLLMYYSYWLAGFYVVIEGYKSLGLPDKSIDALLDSQNVAILKKYRHGVYHFQGQFLDQRFTGLWDEVHVIMPWLGELRTAAWSFHQKWMATHNYDGTPKF